MITRSCKTCRIEKELSSVYFFYSNKKKTTFRFECKDCYSKYKKELYEKNREKIIKRNTEYVQKNREKTLIYQKQYREDHEDILKQKKQIYIENNLEQIKQIQSKYYYTVFKNDPVKKERALKYKKKWRSENKERNNKVDKVYRSQPHIKIACNIRRRIHGYLTGTEVYNSSVTKNLGCTFQELKLFIEKQFQSGMSWNSYGSTGWHLDHVIPLIKFDLNKEDQFKRAVHYSNLQPLWAKDNLEKGASYVPTLPMMLPFYL